MVKGSTVTARDPSIRNRLLAALPAEDYERLFPDLTVIPIKIRQVLHRRGHPLRFIYFPNGGVCSLTLIMLDGRMVEVATVGDEGMVGIHAFFGDMQALCETFVQTGDAATAVQLPIDVFTRELSLHGAFEQIMRLYSQTFSAAMMQCIACNALHDLHSRCCRWLLMTHDRVHEDEFALSHEFLAIMLGARRPTVSAIASDLQRAGCIRYRHGRITVVNRRALERRSCECYGSIQRQFARLHL